MIVDQTHNAQGNNYRQSNSGIVNSLIDVRQTILEMMKELHKTNKFIPKHQIHQTLADKIDLMTFERELQKMVDGGDITPAFDNNHFCLV